MRRPSRFIPFGVLLVGLVGRPCDSTRAALPDPVVIPAVVKSDYVLFAHLNFKEIRDSGPFKEVKRALLKTDGAEEWEAFEQNVVREFGLKPNVIDALTFCVPSLPESGKAKFILILVANEPLDKTATFALGKAKPDARGFYLDHGQIGHVHFPDDKTAVIVHPDLAQKYLDGYAKDRTAWPHTAELSKAVTGHAVFLSVRPDKMPVEAKNQRNFKVFGPVLQARAVALTADLKDKELRVALRATFADAIAAGKVRHKTHALASLVVDEVDSILGAKTDLGAVRPALKEAERALAMADIELHGTDLTVSGSYKADFDIGATTTAAVKQIRETTTRTRAMSNLRRIAFSLHAYASSHNDAIPVHAIDSRGRPHAKANEKPLLSWRVGLLPSLGYEALYKQFKLDEPWDSEHNKKLIEKMPDVYAPVAKPGKPGYTHLQMVIGPPAMGYNANLKSTFSDGSANTIAVVEATDPVIWTKPDDVMFPDQELPKSFRKQFGGQFLGGFHAATWDGSVRFVPDTISDYTLRSALTPAGGEVLGNDW